MLSKGELQLDYVTFEPYGEHFPRILVVRDSRLASFRDHAGVIFKLSYKSLSNFLILSIVTVSHYTRYDTYGINGGE